LERIFPQEIINFSAAGFTNDQIEFNPYGAVREGGQITIENTKNKIKIINVRPSGFVKIIE